MAVTSPEEGLPTLRDRFVLLQQRYVDGLAARWSQIEATPREALSEPLHRLCGSAASYGFESLGRQARLAEQLAARDDEPALAQALRQLKRQIDRVRDRSA